VGGQAATESGDKPARHLQLIPIDTPSASERAERSKAKVQDGSYSGWFFWSAGAIAGTVELPPWLLIGCEGETRSIYRSIKGLYGINSVGDLVFVVVGGLHLAATAELGYYPSGGWGTVLVIVLVLVLIGPHLDATHGFIGRRGLSKMPGLRWSRSTSPWKILPLRQLRLCPECYLFTWLDDTGFQTRQGYP